MGHWCQEIQYLTSWIDPRVIVIGSDSGPGSSEQRGPSTAKGEPQKVHKSDAGFPRRAPPPQQPPKQSSQKRAHSNLRTATPPSPAMFSHDSMSADEDENILLSTNEWKFPDPSGRLVKAIKRKTYGNPNKEITIVTWVMKRNPDEASGAYDESFVPQDNAMSLVSGWEVLLRRVTIYLCTWCEGIVSPKVLRKYIGRDNRNWIKLYRYIGWNRNPIIWLCFPLRNKETYIQRLTSFSCMLHTNPP